MWDSRLIVTVFGRRGQRRIFHGTNLWEVGVTATTMVNIALMAS